ncbi:hypothetical protein V1477_003255 [Vespula maculifrons]|uniref:Uncharacterized protein n=1 Tax=Vespula maculifrons TaxID=7453 RepID=A0ABD2CU45_VESMC
MNHKINHRCIQRLLILCCVNSDIINLENGSILQFFPYAEAFSPSGTVVTPDAVDVASVWGACSLAQAKDGNLWKRAARTNDLPDTINNRIIYSICFCENGSPNGEDRCYLLAIKDACIINDQSVPQAVKFPSGGDIVNIMRKSEKARLMTNKLLGVRSDLVEQKM